MIHGKLFLQDKKSVLIEDVMLAAKPWERMRGLLARPPLNSNQALLIKPCSSVHTIGMKYSIDLIYLDKDYKVKKLVPNLRPYRLSSALGAKMVIELFAGSLSNLGLTIGTQLIWEKA